MSFLKVYGTLLGGKWAVRRSQEKDSLNAVESCSRPILGFWWWTQGKGKPLLPMVFSSTSRQFQWETNQQIRVLRMQSRGIRQYSKFLNINKFARPL